MKHTGYLRELVERRATTTTANGDHRPNETPPQANMRKAIIDNPFRVPQELDTDLLQLRKEEKQRRKTEKLEQRSRRSTMQRRETKKNDTSSSSIAKTENEMNVQYESREPRNSLSSTPKKNTAVDAMFKDNDILSRQHPDGRMSIKEFVSKKREMLLLNMKIDTQHENIEKLHRQLKDKEDALNLKEAKLADSMKRFDTFLKETDEKAQNAQRQVERETARRIQKQQDIININNQLKVVQSQISKHNDTLEELSQCKSFMDSITPPSWFDECAAEKRRRQQQRRRYRINARQETFRIEQQKMLEKKGAENNEKRSSSSRRRARKAINSPADKEPLPVPDFEDEPQTSSDEEFPMYFQSSDQLYHQFNELETEHLDLVKIVEEGRDTLSNIQAQIKSITDELESKTGISDVSKTQSQILNEVTATQEVEMKIKEVYKQCHPESDIDSDLPAMISGIRVTMETLLSKVEDMPSEWFKAKLKEMSDD
jgi:hypothetical protein